jgi:hypothetical protein
MTDLLIIIGLTLASCIAVGLIGLFLLHLVRYRSLRQQLTIATLLPVVAVATTVLINVQLMFLSAHDSLVILIALLVSLLLAALGAWLVVRRISRASAGFGRACTSSCRTRQMARRWWRIRSRLPPLRGSSHKCWTTWPKPAEPLPNRELASALPNSLARSWSASCPMICARRWLVCGPCRKVWRTV